LAFFFAFLIIIYKTCNLQKFMATYGATWTSTSLLRPTDRNPERTKAWIEEIYQNKKYFSDNTAIGEDAEEGAATPRSTPGNGTPSLQQNGHAHSPSASGIDSTISNDEDVVHVLELTDLGAGMAKLEIGGRVVAVASSSSSSPSSKQPKSPPRTLPKLHMPGTAAAVQPPSPAIVSSPTKSSPAASSPRPAPAVEAEPVAVAAVMTPQPSILDSWDPFGDVEPTTANGFEVEAPALVAPLVENGNGAAIVEDTSSTGWDAFADNQVPAVVVPEENIVQKTTPTAALHELLSAPPAAVPPQAASTGWAVDFSSHAPQHSTPASTTTLQPPTEAIPGRKEISLDTFYPEFETIRATGVLPTGQPVLQAQMAQWGVSPYSQQQQQQMQQQQQQHQFNIVPPSPAGLGHSTYHSGGALPSPGNYASHLSPQQQQYGMYAPNGTPTGPYYPAPSPVYGAQQHHQQQQQYMPPLSPQPLPSPLVASVGTANSQQRQLGVDPFAHLTPSGVGNQGQMHAALPTPPALSPPPPIAANVVVPGSQTQAASATLFGTGTNLTAYDLSAPAAPKARASGNPFA
jgi:hypothetical protein